MSSGTDACGTMVVKFRRRPGNTGADGADRGSEYDVGDG